MSNYVSILSKAYYTNVINEATEAGKSLSTMMTSREALVETDVAKVSSFGLKVLGTVALIDLGFTVLGVVRKRSISVGRLFFTVASFFFAFDFLKASNNLREKYVAPLDEKLAKSQRGNWNTAMELGKHVLQRGAQTVIGSLEDTLAGTRRDREAIEEIRVTRVFQVAIQETSIFEPAARALAVSL